VAQSGGWAGTVTVTGWSAGRFVPSSWVTRPDGATAGLGVGVAAVSETAPRSKPLPAHLEHHVEVG
jgi:hypothetical protein